MLFNEYSVSINYTTLKNNNTENRLGFGLGVFHLFLPEKKINLLLGFEYNRTAQYKKSMYEGRFANAVNLTYTLNCISIPLIARWNWGENFRFFVEAGAFADLLIYAKRKGYYNVFNIDDLTMRQIEINEKVNMETFNYGCAMGIGSIIPIKKYNLLIKLDYKYGIRNLYDYMDNLSNRYIRLSVGIHRRK